MTERIYKIVARQQWAEAAKANVFRGAPIDVQDGFIHFSAASQVVETVAKHFAGQSDLLFIEVDANRLGEKLKWEVSRGGELFPHLYGDMSLDTVVSVADLPLGPNGVHVFPDSFDPKSKGANE